MRTQLPAVLRMTDEEYMNASPLNARRHTAGDIFTPARCEHVLCEVAIREQQALGYSGGVVKKRSKGSYEMEVSSALDTGRFKRRRLEYMRVPSVSAVSKREERRKGFAISTNLMKAAAKGRPLRKSKPCAMRLVLLSTSPNPECA